MTSQVENSSRRSIWRELADIVDRFALAWEEESIPPSIQDFVPPADSDCRRLALIELVKVDLHKRHEKAVEARRIRDYIEEWPELKDDGGVPGDLLFEEIQVRRSAGESVDFSDYTKKYPESSESLTRLLNEKSGVATTAILAMRQTRSFKPGDTVDDFELLSELGRGGFATVYLARQKSMQRLVALKISSDQGAEPQTLAQLDHPNIVRVYDQRQIQESADKNQRLLYMQYVSGGTLLDALNRLQAEPNEVNTGSQFLSAIDQHLDSRGESADSESASRKSISQLTWLQIVARIGRQLAEALDYAHKKGVLHRDLKPANVLLTSEGTAKLVDFNVSFCSKVEGASPAAYFGGSLPYMSPEQIEACNPEYPLTAEALDHRSDIFSLGILLFELLTGKRPFADPPATGNWTTVLDVMAEQRQVGIPRSKVESAFGDCHLLRHAIMKCLEPLPENRFKSCSEVAELLRSCESGSLDNLLFPKQPAWIERALTWVIPIVFMCALVPSAAMAWFVKRYNNIESIPTVSEILFNQVVRAINGIAFPLALLLIIVISLPVSKVLRQIRIRKPADLISKDHPNLLERTTNLIPSMANIGGLICITEWSVAGLLYPVVLSYYGADLMPRAWFDFIGSHVLAGLVVASYTFFGIAFFAMWFWFPKVLGRALIEGKLTQKKPVSFSRLSMQIHLYQMVAAAVPFASVALLVFWGEGKDKFALGVLSATSFIGVGALFWLARRVQTKMSEFEQIFATTE